MGSVPALSVVGHRSEAEGTETHGHARTGKGTPLKTSVFWAYLPKTNNCPTHLSHNCPTHLSHNCPFHLSHKGPIPISHYVLTSHFICEILNIDVPVVLVLPHSTHNSKYALDNLSPTSKLWAALEASTFNLYSVVQFTVSDNIGLNIITCKTLIDSSRWCTTSIIMFLHWKFSHFTSSLVPSVSLRANNRKLGGAWERGYFTSMLKHNSPRSTTVPPLEMI